MRGRGSHRALLAACLLTWLLGACRALDAPAGGQRIGVEGNASLSSEEIDGVIGEWGREFEEGGFRKSTIDDAAYLLEEHYRGLGYVFAQVTYRMLGAGDRALLSIDEGPRLYLEGIALRGEEFDGARQLLERSLGLQDAARVPYAPSRVARAGRDLLADLRLRGYQDARVVVGEPLLDAEAGSARVSYELTLGDRWWLHTVNWTGIEDLSAEDGATLAEIAAAQVERDYTPRLREDLRRAASDLLRNGGYPDAEVAVTQARALPGGAVELELEVRPGPRVEVTEVRFQGNERTRRTLLEERLGIAPGQAFDQAALDRGLGRLYALGAFAEVTARLEPPEGPRRALVVEVRELQSVEVYVEPGYGAYELARIRAGIVDRNALGRGRTLRADAGVSLRSLEAEVGYTDPLFLADETTLDAVVKFERREEPSFEFQELGLDLGLSRSWTSRLSSRVTYSLRNSDLLSSKVGTQPVATLTDFDLSSVEIASTYDTRDSGFNPANGYQTRLSLELASEVLGSEVDFLRGVWNHAHYTRLGERSILAARVRAGVVAPIGTTDAIPLQERFFLGGENSIRSFRESELGPKDADGDPVGGEAMSLLSVELRHRLTGRFEGALFAETGNVLPDRTRLLGFEGYRHAVGFGIRYVLPVGPLRLDLGINPNPRDGEDRYVLQASVGRPY